jgi:hypothetical protein
MAYRIRHFELDDVSAVMALCDWAWWAPRSAAGWRWLAEGPPGAADIGPAGWVAEREDDGTVGAFVGNFIQRFAMSDRELTAATGHSLLVHPRMRGASRDLLRRFVRQDGQFALYTFNANDKSAPLYKHFDMHAWPPGQSAVKYVWRTDWTGVASERAVRWFNGLSGHAGSRAGGERFLSPKPWTGHVGWCASGVLPLEVADIDGRFDTLWDELRGEGRLLAFRDAASLRWRCADPDMTCPPVLLGYEWGGRLAGYLLAFFSKGSEVERPSLEIIDMIALKRHEAAAIPALIRTLLASSRALGAVRVRLQAVNPEMEKLLAPFALARRVYGHDHCHVRWREGFGEDLKASWFATPYDGDYSFCIRPPPRPARLSAA